MTDTRESAAQAPETEAPPVPPARDRPVAGTPAAEPPATQTAPEPPPTPATPPTPPTTIPASIPAPAAGPVPTPMSWRTAMSAITSVGPPVTLATALLYYFGWARSDVQARELGVDLSVLGMTSTDYLLNSISSLYVPLLVVGVAALGWLQLQARISAHLDEASHLPQVRALSAGLLVAAFALPLAAKLVELTVEGWDDLLFPLALALGVLLLGWGLRLRAATSAAAGTAAAAGGTAAPRTVAGASALTRLVVGALVALALFWELSSFAGVVGRGLAEQVARPGNLLSVRLYAKSDLQIDAPGVQATTFGGEGSAYRVRYSGLRLLQHSGGRYFLLPDGWTRAHPVVLVIADDHEVRLEFDSTGR